MTFDFISGNGWLQLLLYFGVLFACVAPLGAYMAKIYQGERTFLSPIVLPLEKAFYAMSGINPEREMNWRHYAAAVIVFSFGGWLLLFAILMLQAYLPFNPEQLPNLSPHLAFNTAVSFITNTNWQSYGGEATMSYFSQMAGLTVQNFISAACGMAVLIALIRSMTRRNAKSIGNFWVDMVRTNLYILLPLALIYTILLGSQGVVQSFAPYVEAQLLEAQTIENAQTKQAETI